MSCVKKEPYRFRWSVNQVDAYRKAHEYHERFGSAPVRDSYWAFGTPGVYTVPAEVRDLFNNALTTPPHTLVFRRLENLMPEKKDILLEAFLGFQDIVGYRFANHIAIVDDAWVLNLRTTKENYMMEALLKRMKDMVNMPGIDVGEELKDLLQVYTDAEVHLKEKEASALEVLTSYMKRYVEACDERKKVSSKLYNLKLKLAKPRQEEEDEDEECT
jgi:hypothetical protein